MMLDRLVQYSAFRLVRLFYSRIEVRGLDTLRAKGPLIFVANHPNSILDPILLMAARKKPITFLAKSTLFATAFARWAADKFGALPIFRRGEIGTTGGAQSAQDLVARNEATFARCRRLLHEGGAMALFPEGASHSEPQLMPVRSGAARIALTAEEEAQWTMDLHVVPVGLWYENKTRFRTSALLVVGESLAVGEYRERFAQDRRKAVQALTEHIERGLDGVVLQAENSQLLKGIPAVAAWTAPEGSEADLSQRLAWAATLLSAYKTMRRKDPVRLERIADEARGYARLLHNAGVADPWQLEEPSVDMIHLIRRILWLVLLCVPALLGVVLTHLPYRLSGYHARAAWPSNRALAGTVKLLGGTVLIVMAWVLEAILVGLVLGIMSGALLLVLAAPCAYAAVRWGERWLAMREVLAYRWMRERRAGLVAHLAARRRDLARHVQEAVGSL